MSKKRDEMMAFIESNIEVRSVIQEKPYTAVDVIFECTDVLIPAKGFSKVKWPDEWDKEFGLQLAKKKAISKIYKEWLMLKAIVALGDLPPFKGHHLGDPCIYCNSPHDEVEVGSCPNSNNL